METWTEPTEAELAAMSDDELKAYAAKFTISEEINHPKRLESVISVRFTAEELDELRRRAGTAGMRVTAYIRAKATQDGDPIDVPAVLAQLAAADRATIEAQRLLQGVA